MRWCIVILGVFVSVASVQAAAVPVGWRWTPDAGSAPPQTYVASRQTNSTGAFVDVCQGTAADMQCVDQNVPDGTHCWQTRAVGKNNSVDGTVVCKAVNTEVVKGVLETILPSSVTFKGQ